MLVGVINSIAVRRDPKAVSALIKKLNASDPDVASAAAVALGRIGGTKAAEALSKSLATAPEAVRPAVAQGCILCAERLIAQGKRPEAVKLYDTVRVCERALAADSSKPSAAPSSRANPPACPCC